MVGPLTAEIGSEVWGTPAHFNGFRVSTSSTGPDNMNFGTLTAEIGSGVRGTHTNFNGFAS